MEAQTQTTQTTTAPVTTELADTVPAGEGEGESTAEVAVEAPPAEPNPAVGLTPATGAVVLLLVGLLAVAVVKLRKKL